MRKVHFLVKYSFDAEIEINPLSILISKLVPYATSIRNPCWELNYLTVSDAENPVAKQHLGKNMRHKKSILLLKKFC